MNSRILILFILLVPGAIIAQIPSTIVHDSVSGKQCYPGLNFSSYTSLLFGDFKQQATAPFRMDQKQVVHLGEFEIATAGLFVIDPGIDKLAGSLRSANPFINEASPVITQLGGPYSFYFIGACGLYSLIGNDKRAQVTTLLATQAMITSGIWTRVGKLITSRERPSASYSQSQEPGGEWYGMLDYIHHGYGNKKMSISSFDAFPSGHTATVFSIATVFAKMYADQPVIPVIAYSTATLVGLSRLTEHAHWMSDVLVGAALGYLCGTQVVNNYRNTYNMNSPAHQHKNITLSMDYNSNQFLVGIQYKL
jgi:hypothetical protein